MLIENSDAFKSWLTSVLEPLCDADPQALAKYVFALVKKDRNVDDLRQGMLEQLDVFLQSETKSFVELLFKTLETQDYLLPTIPNANPPNPNVPTVLLKKEPQQLQQQQQTPPKTELIVKDQLPKPIIPVSTLPNLLESINGNVLKKEEVPQQSVKPRDRERRKSDSQEKDERTRSVRVRHRSSSRNRSRSRSWERGKPSRSPRNERDRRGIRPWRNKSPPRGSGTRYDRRRSGTPGQRLRSRSRSPRHSYRGRYRNRSPPPRSLTRSRSRSTERFRDKRDAKTDLKDENSGGATPTQDSNHGDTDMRLTNTTQSIQSVVSALNPVDGSTGAAAAGAAASTGMNFSSGKRRCRDFDEKGYCMRGEMCQYDHGVDPVVLEDTALTRVLTFGPNGPNGASVDCLTRPPNLMHHHHHHHNSGPIVGPNNIHMSGVRPPGSVLHPTEYNPSAPAMWHHRPGFRGGPRPLMGPRLPLGAVPGPFMPLPSMQRELINVPVMADNSHGGFKRRGPNDYDDSPDAKRKPGFDFSRLGPRAKNPVNCSLELKKVPRGLNNITHLNNHFAKFGKIVNIQVCYDGDPEGAIVTFSSHAEANAAYRSTEAVLNNRFIKVFWHSANGTGTQDMSSAGAVASRPIKDRLGQQPVNANKVLNLNLVPKPGTGTDADEQPQQPDSSDGNAYVPSNAKKESIVDTKALANAAIVKGQEILAAKEQLKKKQEQKRKEALKITQDLRKRKQELLEKQLAQQKLLIEKLEKTNPTGQQRDLLMSTIKTVQESIESIRKDMLSQTSQSQSSVKQTGTTTTTTTTTNTQQQSVVVVVKKSKEEAQKEVLDAELDLITKQQEGADTSELQRKLLELRAQAYSLTKCTRGGGGGVGVGVRGKGRGRGLVIRSHALLTKNNLLNVDNNNSATRFVAGGRGGVIRGAVAGQQKHHLQTVVDHRPTRILVSGYEADEHDNVLAHFAQYGEIVDYVTDDSTPSVIINYKTRKEAEVALLKGKHFQDRTLSVTWCTNSQLNSQRNTSRTTVLLNDSSEDLLLEGADEEMTLNEPLNAELSEEALLQDDEDDDDEDRSWRR